MERHTAATPPSVIELVIEGTLEFEVTYETRPRPPGTSTAWGPQPSFTPPQPNKVTPAPKVRPVATVRPTRVNRILEASLEEQKDAKLNETDSCEASDDLKEATSDDTTAKSKEASAATDSNSSRGWNKVEAKIIVDENCNNIVKTSCVNQSSSSTQHQENHLGDQARPLEGQILLDQQKLHSQTTVTEEEPKYLQDFCKTHRHSAVIKQEPKHLRVSRSTHTQNPCWAHRDCVRALSTANKNSTVAALHGSTRKMEGEYQEGCHNGLGCEEGHGCEGEQIFQVDKEAPHKETPITECLDEFLEKLHLSHLVDYLRVLGCTCVRDLRLLEKPELDAIQLISRRRLLRELDSLNLHHEVPPSDCSLEGWLTWYGLTHISGFLKAIGVHSVADMSYLREDDLQLLKPVTRRRIIACHRKTI